MVDRANLIGLGVRFTVSYVCIVDSSDPQPRCRRSGNKPPPSEGIGLGLYWYRTRCLSAILWNKLLWALVFLFFRGLWMSDQRRSSCYALPDGKHNTINTNKPPSPNDDDELTMTRGGWKINHTIAFWTHHESMNIFGINSYYLPTAWRLESINRISYYQYEVLWMLHCRFITIFLESRIVTFCTYFMGLWDVPRTTSFCFF